MFLMLCFVVIVYMYVCAYVSRKATMRVVIVGCVYVCMWLYGCAFVCEYAFVYGMVWFV